ncbi:MAG: ABC transporter ATP-binding protein [Clostridiales bacterium]|nr:ABC transporter ATP-binding protein [Clostridiales bacterium]
MQYNEEQDYTKRFDVGVWKKILRIAKPFHRHLIAIVALMSFTAVFDISFPLLNRQAIDRLAAGGTLAGLGGFIALYAGMIVGLSTCILVFINLSGAVEIGLCRLIRNIGFKRLQELPFSFYDKTPVGYLIARLTGDTQRLGDTVGWGLMDFMWSLAYIVIVSVTMLLINWKLALIVLAAVPVIAAVAMVFQMKILSGYREVRKINSKITGAFNEGIMGAQTTKTLVREEANEAEFRELTTAMRRSSVRAALTSATFLPIVVSLGGFATALVLSRGGYEVSVLGTASIGTLTAFMSYATQIFEPITNIARRFAEMQQAQAAAERVVSLLETVPEIADTPEVLAEYGDSFHPKKENWPKIHGDISFRHVSFQYGGGGEEVLRDFNLEVKAGQSIAIVGETGSGKSTIVNLLCRFYEPTEGEILIDGVDYRKRSQLWLQSNLGYVLQTPHLFSGTVRENIRYGRLEATDEEVEAAARLVNAEMFIRTLDKGYDTDVGEGGNLLSTGQKQLISFARAMIANPALFILDEATSSVDTETEQKIQRAINTALTGRTSFIIAHRLSTIRNADRILVLHQGEIIQSGTHRELLASKGVYHNLYTNQFRDEQERSILSEA